MIQTGGVKLQLDEGLLLVDALDGGDRLQGLVKIQLLGIPFPL